MKRYVLNIVLLTGLLTFFTTPSVVLASACSVSVSPSSIRGGATSAVTYSVLNQDEAESLVQVQVSTTAVDEFQLQTASGSGWTTSLNGGNSVIFTDGAIGHGQTGTFTLNLQAIDQDQSSIQWDVQAGASPDGSGMTSCTGSSGVAIYKSSSTTGATLINTGTTGITSAEATISWTTSTSSTSLVEYGTSSSYGSSKSSATLTTVHSLTLTGLSASTTYHFKVTSVDSQGNTVSSSDYTFSTSGEGSTTTTTTTTVITPTSGPTQTPTPTLVPDRTKPMITIKTDLSKPVKIAPTIEGEASDNKGVAKVEYSLDGGSNWIEMSMVLVKNNSTKATFSFIPPQNLEDGNYSVLTRVTDTSGNTATSKQVSMIIDRLDPQIGPHIFHLGSLVLEPQANGEYLIPSDTLISLTFSAIGGPTSIVVKIGDQIVSAKKHIYSGLWKVKFSLSREGRYEVLGTATDGAGNVTSRSLGFVSVQSKGHIRTSAAQSEIVIYVKQPQLNDFVKWDGEPYGLPNPVKVAEDGQYSVILPAGTYYLHISSPGTIPANTSIFTFSQPTIVKQEFVLDALKGLKMGPFILSFWDLWRTNSIPFNQSINHDIGHQPSALIGKSFPSFSLASKNEVITELSVRGNASVVTVMSSWSPFNQVQLTQMEKIDEAKANIIALFPHESSGSVLLNKSRAGYRTNFLADKDGELYAKLDAQTIPTHYFIDRQGIIRNVIVGVLTDDEIMHNLIY